jgi:hypothetical protein
MQLIVERLCNVIYKLYTLSQQTCPFMKIVLPHLARAAKSQGSSLQVFKGLERNVPNFKLNEPVAVVRSVIIAGF